LIFNVQSHDPGEKKGPAAPNPAAGSFSWVDWGAGIYSGWDLVDNAAVSLAAAAPMMLTPGFDVRNGRTGSSDRCRLGEVYAGDGGGRQNRLQASQTRNQETVSDATGVLADACMHCHEVYRDKRGRGAAARDPLDPSNKAARCVR